MLVAELRLGGSRAAELRARTSGVEDKAEVDVELAIGLSIPSTSQPETRLRPIAEPWARRECVERESGRSPGPDFRAHSLRNQRNGQRRNCRLRREVPRNIALAAGVTGLPSLLVLKSTRGRLRRKCAAGGA